MFDFLRSTTDMNTKNLSHTKITNTSEPSENESTTIKYADDEILVATETTSNLNPEKDQSASETIPQSAVQTQSEEDVSKIQPIILPNEKCNGSIAKHLTFSKDFVSQAF
mmetsp:Transcript_15541/g.22159  ORF Transcript_15541/g.22159 Transcript_15541/m.22159 type:complete len:110 (+) Transcript_15541:187-516(+)